MRNLKRALSLALAAIMVMGLMVVGASAASTYDNFTDKDEIVNTEAVNTMVSLGVLAGKDDGSYFDPAGTVTRGEMAKIIAVCLNGGKDPVLGDSTNIPKFSDVPSSHWAYNYIAYCVQQNIIAGRGDGTFDPGAAVTGSEAAKMFLCALGYRADLEGLLGNEWELNTNVLANQEADLYEGLEAINPSQGLSRDNTAQMAYNAVQAQEVTYNNLFGDYTGVLQTETKGTMLANRFHVVKVEGVVTANEIFAIDGGAKTVAGKARFVDCNTWTDEKGNEHGYDAIYPVSISNDLVGRRVVIYVQFQNNLAPNAASSKVIGEPILSNENTVVSTADKLATADKVKSFLSENNLVMGTANAAACGVGAATGTSWTSSTTAPTLNSGVNEKAGRQVTFIDNDGDNVVDYVITEVAGMGKVSVYDDTNKKLTVAGIGSVEFKNIADPAAVALDDIALYVKYGDTYYLTKAETVSGKFEAYNASSEKLRMDGTEYGTSAVADYLTTAGAPTLEKYTANKDLVGDTYTLYLDFFGNAVAQELSEETLGNYAVVLDAAGSTSGNYGSISNKGEAKLLMADGSTATYNVNLLASANKFGGLGGGSNSDKETAMAQLLDGTAVTGYAANAIDYMIVTYTVGEDGKVVLGDPNLLASYDSVILGTASATAEVKRSQTTYEITGTANKTVSGSAVDGNGVLAGESRTVLANDSTIFFFVDKTQNGGKTADPKVVVGLSNLPTTAIQTSANGDSDAFGAVWDTRTSGNVAKAIVVDAKYEGTANYLYVVDDEVQTKNENGETIYTYDVVFDNGEAGQIQVRGGTDDGSNAVVAGKVYSYLADGKYTTLKAQATTAYVSGTKTTNATINGYVTTYAKGNTIELAWGLNRAQDSKSLNLSSDITVINVQDGKNPYKTSLSDYNTVALATDSDGLVKVAFVKDINVTFRTVTNGTNSNISNVVNMGAASTTGDAVGTGTLGTGASNAIYVASGFSVKINGLAANAKDILVYKTTSDDKNDVKTEYADSNSSGVASFTMPAYASAEITSVAGGSSGGSVIGGLNTLSTIDEIQTALNSAKSGQTVELTGDYTTSGGKRIDIPAGVTFKVTGNFVDDKGVTTAAGGKLEVAGSYTNNTGIIYSVKSASTVLTKATNVMAGSKLETGAITGAFALTVNGDLTAASVADALTVNSGTSAVSGTVGGDLTVNGGDARINDVATSKTITVTGGALTMTKTGADLTTTSAITVEGGTMTVAQLGANTVTLGLSGDATKGGTLNVGSAAPYTGDVDGAVTLHGTSVLNAGALGSTLTLNNTASATVTGVTGAITDAAGTTLVINNSSEYTLAAGTTALAGTVTFSGDAKLAANLAANGTLTFKGKLTTNNTSDYTVTVADGKTLTVEGVLDKAANVKGANAGQGAKLVFGSNGTAGDATTKLFKTAGGAGAGTAVSANEEKGQTFEWTASVDSSAAGWLKK